MGPRSSERGNKHGDPNDADIGPLQWGRARLSAETRVRRQMASMSRDASLQWGRARLSAETRRALEVAEVGVSFNGAALV